MHKSPQGRKSQIEFLSDGKSVKKTYSGNGERAGKFRREVGFLSHYKESKLIPKLIDLSVNDYIVIERAEGDRMSDISPLPSDELLELTDNYVDELISLFRGPEPTLELKGEYYEGIGAEENLGTLIDNLSRLAKDVGDCGPIFQDICDSVARVEISEDLLIKLDWNPENLFLKNGAIHRFIDFEQAFFGTKEILVGVLLHNPIWPASRLFSRLRDLRFFGVDAADLPYYMAFGFGSVVVDSIKRRGKPWDSLRLKTAYERHVLTRLQEVKRLY